MHRLFLPKPRLFCRWACLLIVLLMPTLALAQQPAPAKVGQPVQQPQFITSQGYRVMATMPELPPGGGGAATIIQAIMKQLHYPPAALRQHIQGIVVVSFTVDSTGKVDGSKIIRGIGGGCDEAVLAAVRRLPAFIPGTRDGKPTTITLSIPVPFRLQGSKADLLDTLQRVYPLVDQMPHLPNTEGSTAIFRTIQRPVIMPAEIVNDTLPRKIFVGFIVGPSGVIRNIKIVRGLSPACNAAALAAVQKLPRLVGGTLNGAPASVSMTVPVLFGLLPKE
jgi:TonB family protein